MGRELDSLYCRFLSVGFVVLREASDAGDMKWLASELELLHNVPSLIGETNAQRHEYFWTKERMHYVATVTASDRQMQISRMRTYYEPIWQAMAPLMKRMCHGG